MDVEGGMDIKDDCDDDTVLVMNDELHPIRADMHWLNAYTYQNSIAQPMTFSLPRFLLTDPRATGITRRMRSRHR